MTQSITPAMENVNNSTSKTVLYVWTVTTAVTPAHTTIKANTNLTVTYRSD